MKTIPCPVDQRDAERLLGLPVGALNGWREFDIPIRQGLGEDGIDPVDFGVYMSMATAVADEAKTQGFVFDPPDWYKSKIQ